MGNTAAVVAAPALLGVVLAVTDGIFVQLCDQQQSLKTSLD